MKVKRFYTRLLFTFIGVLLVTEVLILILFMATAGHSFRDYFKEQSRAKLVFFRQMVQDRIDSAPDTALAGNKALAQLISQYAALFKADIWITDTHGRPVFGRPSPDLESKLEPNQHESLSEHGIDLYFLSKRRLEYGATVRLTQGENEWLLHLHFKKAYPEKPRRIFLIGLLVIGLVIAVSLIPLAKTVTRRINRLNQAALDFARGDLSQRTQVKGNDEIAGLAQSFNFMAAKLEKMIRDSRELTANISHELRSPLARITVSIQLIRDRLDRAWEDLNQVEIPDRNKILRYMDQVDEDIHILDGLIDRILTLSRMELQTQVPDMEPVSLNQLVPELIDRFGPQMDQKQLALETVIEAPAAIWADKTMVSTAISNLVDNAVKYTREKGRIKISLEKRDAEKADKGQQVVLTLANTFRRLEPRELKKLFEPFYRLGDTGSPCGSGLGLAIAQKQVEHCSGRIRAFNSSDGLAFEVRFPGA